jgi:diguanylate cyclase (GGDEF)-like protein
MVEWSDMVTGFFTGETGGSRTPEHIAAVTVARHAALAMMRLSRITAVSALAAGAFLLVCIWLTEASPVPPLLWAAGLLGVLAVRLPLDRRLTRDATDQGYRRWALAVTWQQSVFGLIWGMLPWLPGVAATAPSFDLLVAASVPVAIGIVIGQAASLRACLFASTLFSLSFGLFLVTRGDTHNMLLGIFCLVMNGVQAGIAVYLSRQLLGITRLRLANESLLDASKAQHQAAAGAAAYLQEILDCMDYGVTVYDSDLCLKAWNQAVTRTHILPRELLRRGMPIRELVRGSTAYGYYGPVEGEALETLTDNIVDGMSAAYRQGGSSWTFERADGRQFKVRNIVLSNGDMVVSSDDITDVREAMNEELKRVTRHCELTGLLNRAAFRRDLELLMHTAQADDHRIAVQTMDIESFRSINSALGAEVGDQVLKRVADRLREHAPDNALIARLGDEFAIAFCGNLSTEDIMSHCADIIQEAQARMTVDGHSVALAFNAGVALFPDHARQAGELMDKVALAQKAAREGDKGKLCLYSESLSGEDRERNSLRLEIWRALAQKEFMLYFQPQIDMASGRVVAAETLLRWLHPEFGWVPPSKFIPVAETSQQIVEITEWLLPAACREAKAWLGRGWTDLVVSVNISAVHFHTGDLVDLVYRSLVESGLPAQNLELELTESVLLPNAEHVEGILTDLGDLGVRLAIDDFGTGYSAMSYLRRFPMQKLKIDGSFVRELSDEPESRSIVEAIAQVGHTLGNYVVAEGVETPEQLRILKDIGCDGVQGYLYSKALPAEHFINWVEQHNARTPQKRGKPPARRGAGRPPLSSPPPP